MSAFRVVFDAGTAFIIGPKGEIRRRIEACGDHAPQWVRHRGAWATSPAIANAVIDQLEARRIEVLIEHTDQTEMVSTETVPANVLDRSTLW